MDEEDSLGLIRHDRGDNFEVKRARDETYHSTFATRREAADWLLEHIAD